MAEFAYNNNTNHTIGLSPFESATEVKPSQPIDLIPLPQKTRPSEAAESFAKHIYDLYAEIRR